MEAYTLLQPCTFEQSSTLAGGHCTSAAAPPLTENPNPPTTVTDTFYVVLTQIVYKQHCKLPLSDTVSGQCPVHHCMAASH
jgi:hypothetical protein